MLLKDLEDLEVLVLNDLEDLVLGVVEDPRLEHGEDGKCGAMRDAALRRLAPVGFENLLREFCLR